MCERTAFAWLILHLNVLLQRENKSNVILQLAAAVHKVLLLNHKSVPSDRVRFCRGSILLAPSHSVGRISVAIPLCAVAFRVRFYLYVLTTTFVALRNRNEASQNSSHCSGLASADGE